MIDLGELSEQDDGLARAKSCVAAANWLRAGSPATAE
jgi:hypothetical protein